MNIYLHPSGVKKELKNDYIGEYKWWEPWSNTLVYYPLNWNANDLSWNWKNGTASNITWNSWWDRGCAYFNWNSYISVPSLWTNANITISFRMNSTENIVNWWDFIMIWGYVWSSNNAITLMTYSKKLNIQTRTTNHNLDMVSTVNICDWIWHYITVIATWSTAIWYIDWVSNVTNTNSYYTLPPLTNIRIWMHTWWSANKYTWYIDNMIIENRQRTAQEIQDYYNNTKSNYWL